MAFVLMAIVVFCDVLSAVTLSEIMFDPAGDEGADEFIELYNDGTATLNLDGWRITDGGDTDRILAIEQGLLLAPGQYLLILDPDYFDDGSTGYDGLVPETAIVVTLDNATFGSRGLSNSSSETISLLNTNGVVLSSYAYSTGNMAGFSDEKRILTGPNDASNWGDSRQQNGSPGSANSLTPPNHDVAVISLRSDPPVVNPTETFRLLISVANLGSRSAGGSLQIYEMMGADTLAGFDRWENFQIAVADTIEFVSDYFTLAEETRTFRAIIDSTDERIENNARIIAIRPGGSQGGLRINEVMFAPASGRSEWVELINAGGTELDLREVWFADGSLVEDSTAWLRLPPLVLAPDSFLTLAADSTIFFHRLPATANVAVYEDDFPTLSNAGDSLFIFVEQSQLIERVDYRSQWSDESGVSAERISLEGSSNDDNNWAPSVDSSGATPCRGNSRSIQLTMSGGSMLTLSPNPFTPNGDARDEELTIQIELDHAAAVLDLSIYDVRGRLVRKLVDNRTVSQRSATFWDGRDSQGRVLPSGMYIIYAEAAAEAGSRIQKSRRIATLIRPS